MQFSFTDFVPTAWEIRLPVVLQVVAVNLFVNTVKYLEYEHRELANDFEFDENNPYWTYSHERALR